MTWFKVDDGAPEHPKMRAAGLHGRALWYAAGAKCTALNTDGVVSSLVAKDAAYLAEVDLEQAARALVEVGLWHDAKTLRRCDRCKAVAGKLAPGEYYMHDFLEYQPAKDVVKVPEHRRRERRRKALQRDRERCDAIVERDGHRCRYCAVRVNFADKVGPAGGTYDHVDPDGDNSLENVVVACRKCNGVKKNRTPEEAGMPLFDPPERELAGTWPGPASGRTGAKPESALASASRATPERAGSGQAGARPGPGPDLAPAKSSTNGSHP